MAADFTAQLTCQLNLSEEWEVAMTSIIYPCSWQHARTSALLHVALQDKWFALDVNHLSTQWYLPYGQRRNTWFVEGTILGGNKSFLR